MNVRTIAGFWVIAVLFAGVVACRHLGMIDEPDAGPGPHCDPCAEYEIRVNECLKPACDGMECGVCEYEVDRFVVPSCAGPADGGSGSDTVLEISPGTDFDAGRSCSGSEREEAYARLQWFTCEDDEYVAGLLDTIERECVPVVSKACTTVGSACSGGYCYFTDADGPLCMTEGNWWVGDVCANPNDCADGAQCLQAGANPMLCYEVCQSDSGCSDYETCEDTGFGFKVCVYTEE